ncbi:MAG TPA: hypothetical protein VKT82_07285 [Ktedonobacterales bacterium]|nr:hypothetical protein [Ktedonobacterales bacterium]
MGLLAIAQSLVSIIGIPVALGSLLLLARQTRSLEKSIRSQVYQGLTENAFRIDEILLEYPQFRDYLYDGKEVGDDTPDLARLMMAVELIIDVFENLNVQRDNIPRPVLASWDNYKNHVLNTPAVAYYLNTHSDWYSQAVKESLLGRPRTPEVVKVRAAKR